MCGARWDGGVGAGSRCQRLASQWGHACCEAERAARSLLPLLDASSAWLPAARRRLGCSPPGAVNVPFPMVLEAGPYGTTLKPDAEIKRVFAAVGADLDAPAQRPLVASCGSGLTGCVLALAAYKATGRVVGKMGVRQGWERRCL